MTAIVFFAVFLTVASATLIQDTYSDITEDHSANNSAPASNDTTQAGSDLSPPPTPEESTGPPPDDDPFDCNITRPYHHIYLNCSFICQGDQAVVVPNGEPCSLNHTELHSEDVKTTGTNGSIIGVCYEGQCVANRTDVTVPDSEPSTAETTSNLDFTGTHPKSSPAETTSTTNVPTESSPSEATTTRALSEITTPRSVTEPTTTTGVTETTQESTTPTTTTTIETSSAKGPIRPEHPSMENETPPQTPQSRRTSGPAAVP